MVTLYEKEIFKESDIDSVCRVMRSLALLLGFDNIDTQLIVLGVSELSTNAIKYAGSGTISVYRLINPPGIRVEVEDRGPGMKDVNACMLDGFSSIPTSLGLGLGAVKRASDQFSVISQQEKGTSFAFEKWLSKEKKKNYPVKTQF